jgi:hypothetical protein
MYLEDDVHPVLMEEADVNDGDAHLRGFTDDARGRSMRTEQPD